MEEERRTIYFANPGVGNTDRVLELAKEVAEAENIAHLVFASTRGYTAQRALEICPHLNLVAVGSYRYRADPARTREFESRGYKRIYAYDDVDYDYPRQIQDAYRSIAGEGGKVAPEVVVAAARAGLIQEGERVIGIGGAYPGADTAFVIVASKEFRRLKVPHIICAPRQARS